MGKILVTGTVDYISGHLRYGHYEAEMDEETFLKLKKEDVIKYLEERGELVVDDFSIEDHGEITEISIQKA